MNSSIWFDTINLDSPLYTSRVSGYNFLKKLYFMSALTNSVDPDEMPHYTAFHLGLHCL